LSLADGTDAIVHVLAVVDVTADPMRFDAALVSDLERAKERLVDEVVATAADHDADVTGAVRRGRPARTIVDYADERDIELIVLGRSGRSGIAAPLLRGYGGPRRANGIDPVLIVPEATADAEA